MHDDDEVADRYHTKGRHYITRLYGVCPQGEADRYHFPSCSPNTCR